MAKMARSASIMTPEFRMAWVALTQPRPKSPKTPDKLTYQLTCLFPPGTDLTELKKALADTAKEQWGDKTKGVKSPIRSQDESDHPGYEEGGFFIRTQTEFKVDVVSADGKRLVTDPDEIYPGRWARAMVHAYAWEHIANGKGLSFGLDAVQLVPSRGRPDDRLGGGGKVDGTKAFGAVDGADTEDSNAGESADSLFD